VRDGQRMRRRDHEREAFARVLAQGIGYLGLTGAVVWVMLRLA
jgi:hypothetical protein